MNSSQRGFTVAELLVVMVVTAGFVGLILTFTFSYWRYGYSIQADLDSFTERLNAGDYLRETVGSSSGLITQNSIDDLNPGRPDTTINPAHYWIPQHAIPGNRPNSTSTEDITPIMYFKHYSQTQSRQIIMNGELPYEDEYIVYMDKPSKQLRVRILANPSAPGNKAVTSCPPPAVTNTCPKDIVLMNNIDSADIRYFSKSGNAIDWTSMYDNILGTYVGPDNPTVEVVELKLNVLAKATFQQTSTTKNTTVIRIALRNT